MFSCLQDHFGAAKDRLGREFIGLLPGHAPQHGRVRHGFDQHKNISGGTSADSCHNIEQFLTDHFSLPETVANFDRIGQFFFADIFVGAGCCHAFSHHCGRVGHQPDHFDLFGRELFFNIIQRPAGRNADDQLVFPDFIFDFRDHFLIILRFDRKKDGFRLTHDLKIVTCHMNAVLLYRPLPACLCGVRSDDLIRGDQSVGNDAVHDGVCHISASDKTQFHN